MLSSSRPLQFSNFDLPPSYIGDWVPQLMGDVLEVQAMDVTITQC